MFLKNLKFFLKRDNRFLKRAVSNLFLFLTLSLYSYEIKNEIFMPTRYYVGDSVDFKVSLILNDGEEFSPVDF